MTDDIILLAAPIQGITDHHWRNAHHSIFGGIDAYFAPFMRVEHGEIRKRDIHDALPEHNSTPGFTPQILACQPDDAVRMATTLASMGHTSIDINLGCPFPPIALHHKGSGLMQYPDEVEALFKALKGVNGVSYSVKMRLGWDNEQQWRDIMPLMDILEPRLVTIHPRTGRQQYKGELLLQQFAEAAQACHYPVAFNGEVKTRHDIAAVKQQFPGIKAVMIGRGLVENPAMLAPEKATAQNFRLMHDTILEALSQRLNGGEHQLLMKMKALWELFLPNAPRKARKAIKKASSMAKYEAAVANLFAEIDNVHLTPAPDTDEGLL